MLPVRPFSAMENEADQKPLVNSYHRWNSTAITHSNLQVPDPAPSHSSSPQSSNSSLLGKWHCLLSSNEAILPLNMCLSSTGTPYLAHGDINDGLYRMDWPAPRFGPILRDSRKAPPLCEPYEPSGLADYYSHHNFAHWHDQSTDYEAGVNCPCSLYPCARTQPQYNARSCSDNDSPKSSPSSDQFSSEGSSIAFQHQFPVLANKSTSLSPSMSGNYCLPSPPPQQWNNQNNYHHSYNHVLSWNQNSGRTSLDRNSLIQHQQWTSLPQSHAELHKTLSPNLSVTMGLVPLHSRIGSERTRQNSQSRRTNPHKKVLTCLIRGCGATITSKHNMNSGCRVFITGN